jgi:hypothetical protein
MNGEKSHKELDDLWDKIAEKFTIQEVKKKGARAYSSALANKSFSQKPN